MVVSVYLSMWVVPGRFFQSLPVPCGASLDVTSPDVTNSREKRNQGQFDFLRQKIWQTKNKIFRPWTAQNHFFFYIDQDYLFFIFQLMSVPIKGMDEMSVRLDDGRIQGKTRKKNIQALDSSESIFIFFVLTKTTFFFLLATVHPN